jgi:hypothetical protein
MNPPETQMLTDLAEQVLPDSWARHRGYIPGLGLALLAWGSVAVALCLWNGMATLAQVLVDGTTYGLFTIGAIAFLLGAQTETTGRKTAIALLWSVVGTGSFPLIAIATYVPAYTTVWVGTGIIGITPSRREPMSGFYGLLVTGFATAWLWFRLNRRAFRWMKSGGFRRMQAGMRWARMQIGRGRPPPPTAGRRGEDTRSR